MNWLPDFSALSMKRQKAVATGTDGAETEYKDPENDSAIYSARQDAFRGIPANTDGQPECHESGNPTGRKTALADRKNCFSIPNSDTIRPSARSSVRIERRFPNPLKTPYRSTETALVAWKSVFERVQMW